MYVYLRIYDDGCQKIIFGDQKIALVTSNWVHTMDLTTNQSFGKTAIGKCLVY